MIQFYLFASGASLMQQISYKKMVLIMFTMLLMGLKENKHSQRGKISGWKFENLPWTNT